MHPFQPTRWVCLAGRDLKMVYLDLTSRSRSSEHRRGPAESERVQCRRGCVGRSLWLRASLQSRRSLAWSQNRESCHCSATQVWSLAAALSARYLWLVVPTSASKDLPGPESHVLCNAVSIASKLKPWLYPPFRKQTTPKLFRGRSSSCSARPSLSTTVAEPSSAQSMPHA